MTRRTLLALAMVLCSLTARAEGQIQAGISAGVASAGSRSGGLALTPNAAYAARFGEHLEASASVAVEITGLSYHNLGLVAQHALAVGYYWPEGFVLLGPSVDIYDTMLCGAVFCNRVLGLTPGADLHGAYLNTGSWAGAYVDAHLSWAVSNPVYMGPIWSISIGPSFIFGRRQ